MTTAERQARRRAKLREAARQQLLGERQAAGIGTCQPPKATEPQRRNCKRKGMFSSAPAARPGSGRLAALLLSFPAYAGDDGTFMLSPR